jgi:hypothetical protein
MRKDDIKRLREELQQLRLSKYNLKRSDLVRFAERVGRYPYMKHGKEPTWRSDIPGRNPLSIPGHRKVKPYTANKILDILEADIDTLEDMLEEKERRQNENRKRLPPATLR